MILTASELMGWPYVSLVDSPIPPPPLFFRGERQFYSFKRRYQQRLGIGVPSPVPCPKQESEIRSYLNSLGKANGLAPCGSGEGKAGPGVGLCSVSTRSSPHLDLVTGQSVTLLLPPEQSEEGLAEGSLQVP